MRKILSVLLALIFMFLSVPVFAGEGALKFPMREGSSASADKHNEEGISHFNQGNYDVALKHFQMASSIFKMVFLWFKYYLVKKKCLCC